ncbi:MAG: hypothetical protein IH840_16990 [Candidatus Heimdallarchaeota archaeon]|nr:hypothetical protein [Candidatus Heimdallarchaeota archaeon]
MAKQKGLRKLQSWIVREKKLTAIILSISLVLSILSFMAIYYTYSKNQIVNDLEQADLCHERFTVVARARYLRP